MGKEKKTGVWNRWVKTFKDFPIKRKTITIILAVAFFSIVTTVAVVGVQNIARFRGNLVTKLDAVAKVICINSVAVIDFEDDSQGKKLLDSLDEVSEVIAAVIFVADGKKFVSYKRSPDIPDSHFRWARQMDSDIKFEGQYLYLARTIEFHQEYYGTLYVVASTRNLAEQIYNYLLFSLLLLVITFLLTAILGAWLSRTLTRPILNLADTAGDISSRGDYSIRVSKVSDDEIGRLYDSFNRMLDRLAAQNQEIHKLNVGLEDKVEERTRDLLRAKEQAEDARKRAELADQAKSTFLANMSHEIRTPMNAILGYSGLLLKLIGDKKQREFLEIVQTSGKNLLSLINDILDLSKIESGKMNIVLKPMNPYHLFNEIRNIFKIRTEEKGIDFHIDVAPDIPNSLLMDETRLRQILFNVVGNAVKFTPQGYVKISVSKKYEHQDTSRIALQFKVEDTGIGIPGEQIEHIFKAFEQQQDQGSQYGGTGLGLTITKRLVEMMNGEIFVTSRVKSGSIFTIVLREVEISSLQLDAAKDAVTSFENLFFKEPLVMLVEDNLYNLNLVKALMEDKNIRVTEAVNGREALDKLNTITPDLILMDMKMPVMDGYEATQAIKSDPGRKDIPVIALTADVMKEGREKVREVGCDSFLSKPIDETHLFTELMKHLPYHHDEHLPGQAEASQGPQLEPAFEHLTLETLGEINTQLTGHFMEQWRQIGDSLLLDEWEQFGLDLKALGDRHHADFLADFGRHIIENVEHLNIVELKKTIKNYPHIVETLQKGVSHDGAKTGGNG